MLRSRRDDDREHGQILVLFSLVLVVILAFAAIVVDLGVLRNNRQILLNTFDSAALAGGTVLPVNGASEATAANALIAQTIQANYPGLPESAYSITYKCHRCRSAPHRGCPIGVQPRSVPGVDFVDHDGREASGLQGRRPDASLILQSHFGFGRHLQRRRDYRKCDYAVLPGPGCRGPERFDGNGRLGRVRRGVRGVDADSGRRRAHHRSHREHGGRRH
jgi:hypothetical protein